MYETLRQHLATAVPFANHVGIELLEVSDGFGSARLKQSPASINHVGSQHAGVLFTLGEAASGAAMAGAFASVILGLRPLAGSASIDYRKVGKGTITATARTERSGADLQSELERARKVRFPVAVELTDDDGDLVAEMTVEWSVAKT
ncbi:MAG: DUF4442 domain-containing protein [Erythrobacter sp.]